jgi:hypothetical protein
MYLSGHDLFISNELFLMFFSFCAFFKVHSIDIILSKFSRKMRAFQTVVKRAAVLEGMPV